jgi:phosphoribosylaminoimidazole (AIR) synthetase
VGLHTNGYSLARKIAGLSGDAAADRATLAAPLPGGSGESIGDALMQPHKSYLTAITPALEQGAIKGMAHITGGGILDNVPRMLPEKVSVELDPQTWSAPPIFDYLVETGGVGREERYQVFNMGLGFVAAVAPGDADHVLKLVPESRIVGRVVARDDNRPRIGGLY